MSLTPIVNFKQRQNAEGISYTEIFIDYDGLLFYSRTPYVLPDTLAAKAQQGQEFLRRMKRFPSSMVRERLRQPQNTFRPAHGGYPAAKADLVEFAKQGSPPAPKRPALTLVQS